MKKDILSIKEWIKDYVENSGKGGVVIGLSGGIDSTLVATLCVAALGKEKVHGLILPCFGSYEDVTYAMEVARSLDIQYEKMYLDDIFQAARDETGVTKKLALANLKSRLRMTFLYGKSNELDWLVVGTTNKSEYLVGYYTKYGDGGVDFEPVLDYYKTEIYEMAKELDVSADIINRAPSAGLWEGQTDEGELGMSYEKLDCILRAYETGSSEAPIVSCEDMSHVRKLIDNSEHKRKAPPHYERVSKKKIFGLIAECETCSDRPCSSLSPCCEKGHNAAKHINRRQL